MQSEFDIVVLGAGGAGLMASVEASKNNISVACISKVFPTRSHTIAAKGGINAVLGNVQPDKVEWHIYDTLKGGDWLSDVDAVELMCNSAKDIIIELENMGVPFSRNDKGKIQQRAYGGQTSNYGKDGLAYRSCFVEDRTGNAILNSLYQQALANNVHFFNEFMVLDLIINENKCYGVICLEIATGELHIINSKSLIIATGGYGQLYKNTTSSSICTGDGNALCAKAGLPLKDMEFIQFHPTGISHNGLLITEAVRSEGGILLNNKNERFMKNYSPDYMELSSRAVISRAIISEINNNNGFQDQEGNQYIELSVKHLDKDLVTSKLPSTVAQVQKFCNINIMENNIPIYPTVHYTMGGISVNNKCQVLDKDNNIVEGLFAIGEASCMSIHGANRLGCNSLLEIITFGKLVIDNCNISQNYNYDYNSVFYNKNNKNIQSILSSSGNNNSHYYWNNLNNIMDKYVSIIRNKNDLEYSYNAVNDLYKCFKNNLLVQDKGKIWNTELTKVIELDNLFIQARITILCALRREESRGAHFRQDFPSKNDSLYCKHSIGFVNSDNDINIKYIDIRKSLFSNKL